MQSSIPTAAEVIFLLLTFFLLSVTVLAVGKVSGNKKITLSVFLIIFFWLSFLKIISVVNYFHNYVTMPPLNIICISISKNEPANTVIFDFPYILQPGFVAPYALVMHVFALKKVLNEGIISSAIK